MEEGEDLYDDLVLVQEVDHLLYFWILYGNIADLGDEFFGVGQTNQIALFL